MVSKYINVFSFFLVLNSVCQILFKIIVQKIKIKNQFENVLSIHSRATIYFCMHHHAIPSALYPATRLSQPLYCIFSFSLSMPFWLHCVLFIYSTQDHIRIKLKKWDGKWRRKSCIHICSGRINISSRGRLVV